MKKAFAVLLVFLMTFSTIVVFSPKVNPQDTSQQLTTSSYEDKHPSWSPDGTRIAWVAYEGSWYRHIWVMNSDGTGKTQLTSGSIVDESPIYSPDGSKIMFQRYGFRGDRFDLMTMDSDGSNVQRITFDAIPGKAEGTFHTPRWSEDESKIVCMYGEGTTAGQSAWWIVTMNSDGTNIEAIGRGMLPQYVFGDSKILFNSGDPTLGDERIALMNTDGTGVEYLTDGPYDWRPHMSSISHRIVFNRGSGISADLYIMSQDGSDLHPFISDGQNRKAEWSPDEEYIAYTSGKSGNYDIWKMEAPSAFEISTIIDIDPNTFNLRSEGEWITAYIELSEGYDVTDVNVSTILLNGTVSVDPDAPVTIGDYDDDGIPDLMVKFDRAEAASYILANVNTTQLSEERFMTITLTINGYLNDETLFEGSDTIRIMLPGGKGAGRRTTTR